MFRQFFASLAKVRATKSGRSAKRAARRRPLGWQHLEQRNMLAVDVFYHDGFEHGIAYPDREGVYIVGTAGDDHIEVTEKGGLTTIFAARPTGLGFYYLETSKVPNIHFYGGGGNDTLVNRSSAEAYIFGGEGNDTLEGGLGHCHVYGEGGDDKISVGPLAVAELNGGDGRDTIWGGQLGDIIDGGYGLDVIYAGSGNDEVTDEGDGCIVFGGPGNDTLLGGPGRDLLYGEDGRDYITGGDESDDLFGGPGIDKIFGDDGEDHLEGGAGSDQLNGGPGKDSLFGFEYFLHFGGTSRNDFDTLIGEGGGDAFYVRYQNVNGTVNSDGQGIFDFNPSEGDFTFQGNVDRFISSRLAASYAELAQGAGASPFASTMSTEFDEEIGPYTELPAWTDLGPFAPLDESSEYATLDDLISYLATDDDLVEGENEIAAVDAVFGETADDWGLLESSPETYAVSPSYLSEPVPVTSTSVRTSFRYSAF